MAHGHGSPYLDLREEIAAVFRTRGAWVRSWSTSWGWSVSSVDSASRPTMPSARRWSRCVLEVCERSRPEDMLVSDSPRADRFLLFLTGDRPGQFSIAEHRRLADHIQDFMTPRVARIALAFSRERPTVDVGCGFVLYSRWAAPSASCGG